MTTRTDWLGRLPFLDGMRATAALMVMTFHIADQHRDIPRLVHAAAFGQSGVDLFFVLSGFLITRILLASKESAYFLRTFYVRRVLRIFPLYFGFLAFYFYLLPQLTGDSIPPFSTQLWAWLYAENFPLTFPGLNSSGPGHFWSLAVEEHFYLVWPLLVFVLSRRNFGIAVIATLVIAPVVRLAFIRHGLPVYFFTFTRMDSLAYGAALALLVGNPALRPEKMQQLFRMLLIGFALLVLPAYLWFSGSRFDWLQVVKLSLFPALYFGVIGFCLVDPLARPLVRLFSARWLRWLGGISYGIYVFHPTCITLVQRFVAPARIATNTLLSFGLTIGIAYLSFRFFEAPILRLKRHFAYGVTEPADGKVSASALQ